MSGLATRGVQMLQVVFGNDDTLAGTLYGTLVVMATVTASSEGHVPALQLTLIVVATVLVLWLAHVYAFSIAESIQENRRVDPAVMLEVARRQLSIALAAVGPVAALCLGVVGALPELSSIYLALCVGLAILLVQGVRYSRVARHPPRRAALSIVVNLSLGIAIVLLEVAVWH